MENRNIQIGAGGGFFEHIVSVSNLFYAWNEFRRGKRKKKDVAQFELYLEDNIFHLHEELISKTYQHDPYRDFFVHDPKRRHIHKASVRDRVLHQAMFRVLYIIFDRHFIYDSYSSRFNKGTHFGVSRLSCACRKVTQNWKKPAFALKCDIRKFFDSIDHTILRKFLAQKISDSDILWLIDNVLTSFEKKKGKGLPLGNVTSQLFANIYLNELDQFVKHKLHARYYFRYCDDFVVLSPSKYFLEGAIRKIEHFLHDTLLLELHPHKVEIRKVRPGIDFLGYVVLPRATIIRTRTKQRIFKKVNEAQHNVREGKISKETFESILSSYLGVLSHSCNGKERAILKQICERTLKVC